MKFYRGPKEIADIDVDGSSIHKQTLQGIDILQFSFVLDNYVELVIGDFVNWGTDTFTINKQPSVSKLKTNEYRYNFEMESNQYNLLNVIYMLDNKTTFHLHADLKKFVTHIITNLNRVYSGFQIKGEVPTSNPKNLYFDNSNCFETLQRVCKEFNVEFSISGKVIQIKENIGTDTGLTFKFKKGLRNIEREKVSSSDVITRLYAYGGSRNIPKDYGSDKLRVEPIENNTNLFGIIEGVKVFEDIYPHREGMLTSIDSEDVCKFSDASMDFDINDHLVSKNAKLTFNTGFLAGYEFEIHSYNHSDKKFDIIAFEDENGFELPNENLKPQVGDKYVIHEIMMPQEYIDNAESELKAKATEFLQKQSLPNVTYAIKPDKTYLRKKQIELNVGDVITIEDDDFGVSKKTRIIDVTQSLADKYEYTIKVGDEFVVSYLKLIIQAQAELNAKIVTERRDRTLYYNKLRRIVLSYEELKGAIFDADGYFNSEKIKPLSIETSMLSVGAKGQQLTLSNLILEANYQNNSAKLKVSDAVLAHFTIEEQVKEWRLRGDIFDLPDSSSYYYLYAKCNKNGDLGTFLVTKEQIKTDNGGDYYHFILGVVSSAIDGVRSVSMTYGQTVINGKFIKTGVIQSQDGRMRIDLENGTIHGDVTFTSNSPAFNQMSESVRSSIRDINVGGKNLANKNAIITYLSGEVGFSSYTSGGGSSSRGFHFAPTIMEVGKEYYLSFKIRKLSGSLTCVGGHSPEENYTVKSFKIDGAETETTFHNPNDNNLPNDDNEHFVEVIFNYDTEGQNFYVQGNRLHYKSVSYEITEINLRKGGVRISYTIPPEDLQSAIEIAKEEAKQASNAYANTQDEQKEVHIKAYADGKVTEEEQRAIADAENKLRLAKEYAQAQDNLVKTQVKAYADGKITDAEQRAINVAKAQAQLAKTTAEAYADNIVTEEERKRIAADEAKLREAKEYAQAQDNLLKNNFNSEILKNKKLVENLNAEINGAFKDGIIEQAEARAIEKYINTIRTQEKSVIDTYEEIKSQIANNDKLKEDLKGVKDNYNNKLNALISSINTAIADGRTTTSEKADVDSKFTAYKIAYAKFTEAIQKSTEERLKNIVSRNLASIDSIKPFERGTVDFSRYSVKVTDNSTSGFYFSSDKFEVGKYYYLSFKIRKLSGSLTCIGGHSPSVNYTVKSFKIDGVETETTFHNPNDNNLPNDDNEHFVEVIFKVLTAGSKFYVQGNRLFYKPVSYEITEINLCEGRFRVPYTIPPEDYEQGIQNIADKTNFLTETKTSGAAVATGTLMVGNETGATAGITGVNEIGKSASESTRYFAGSNFLNRGTAPFRVTESGELYATKAHISGEIDATSGRFTGEINADSGTIANFTITDDELIGRDKNDPLDTLIIDGGGRIRSKQAARYGNRSMIFRANDNDTLDNPEFSKAVVAIESDRTEGGGMHGALHVRSVNAFKQAENIAIHIEGEIRVGNKRGYTGWWKDGYYQNGILTEYLGEDVYRGNRYIK